MLRRLPQYSSRDPNRIASALTSATTSQRLISDSKVDKFSATRYSSCSLILGRLRCKYPTLMTSLSKFSPDADHFWGLAPFLRQSIAGEALQPFAAALLAAAERQPDSANIWMNLSLVLQCLNQRDLGLTMQDEALSLRQVFELPAGQQPAVCRVLLLMAPGDVAENTPLECLLESSDIDLLYYYLIDGQSEPPLLPEHDVLLVAMGDSPRNRQILAALEPVLQEWPRPVLNLPQFIPLTERTEVSIRLYGAPGVSVPVTWRAARELLAAVADGQQRLDAVFPECNFPVIIRPQGSQAGRDLQRLAGPAELSAYLAEVAAAQFFVANFIDYRSEDGLFRKIRIAFVAGEPFVCHMAVSSNWMVHYVNAGMYEDAGKRAEEAQFMENFGDFVARHRPALQAICQRIPLDYFCADCAELPDGQLMIFEADHVMVVHAMDSDTLFSFKKHHISKIQQAFRSMLLGAMASFNSDCAR